MALLQLEQPLSTARTKTICASPAPICEISKDESLNTASPSGPHFRASAAPSQSSQHDSDHDHEREPSNMAASNRRYDFLAIAVCAHTTFGFLLPAFVGMMLGYYLRPTLREERPWDLMDYKDVSIVRQKFTVKVSFLMQLAGPTKPVPGADIGEVS
jgi:hypothetical protein